MLLDMNSHIGMFDFVKYSGEEWAKAHDLSFQFASKKLNWSYVLDKDGYHMPTDQAKFLYGHCTTDLGLTSTHWSDRPYYNEKILAPFSLKPNFFNGVLEPNSVFAAFKVLFVPLLFSTSIWTLELTLKSGDVVGFYLSNLSLCF